MKTKTFLFAILSAAVFAGCNGASGPEEACKRVGTELCAKVYACYSAAERVGYPPSQADCVALENARCNDPAPRPGFCKGSPQVSEAAANACGDELKQSSCDPFRAPTSTGACKAGLCSTP